MHKNSQVTQRLYTAITPPDEVIGQLLACRPAQHERIRPVCPEQVHLTLCFIGEARIPAVDHRLRDLEWQPMTLSIIGFGKFATGKGRAILWAGVEPVAALLDLQARMAQCLLPELPADRKTEQHQRPYRPHITLARCRAGAPGAITRRFLNQPLPPLCEFEAKGFSLYSSVRSAGGSIYTEEKYYPLGGRG